MIKISKILNHKGLNENFSDLNAEDLDNFKFAPITPVHMGIHFSDYKYLLSDIFC